MHVLITGGAGFIGHNVALILKGKGYDVIVLDSLERSTTFALQRLSSSDVPLIRGDIRNVALLKKLVSKGDIVVHAAAYISVEESMKNPEVYIDNNVMGSLAVAKVCLEAGASMIYISSAAVYGEPVKLPIDEAHPTKPISPYGLSKLFGEQILELLARQGLRYTVLRLFNVYGPGQSSAYAGVISRFIEQALESQRLIIYGDGLQTRDFVHVYDVAQAVELALEKEAYGEKFNIAYGKPVSILELAQLIKKLTCPDCRVEHYPPRPGDIRYSYADITKAKSVLGYQPTIDLEKGISELIRLKSNGQNSNNAL
ncbi:NAD-dependent epimerase/dehydratase family protein [Infirmifilum uzonense]|uniref:NAD-dependent epimerase/dehydratase family protein n=1 Tax=Infirmifilum uzonense TaxID=1550241 RepID=UPI003C76121C